MGNKRTGGKKWSIRKEALGVYFIFLVNFWMACYEVIARESFKQRMLFGGYDLIFPIVIGLPWIIIAAMKKNKWAWVRSVVVVILAYATRAMTISLVYGTIGRDIHMFIRRSLHTNISFRMDWVVNVTYLILLTIVAFWIYKDELKIKNNEVHHFNPSQKNAIEETKKKTTEEDNKKKPEKAEMLEELKNGSPVGTMTLDINRCTEAEFMTLPGMSILSARKAVEEREIKGEYRSFDDFVNRNEIKPHFMVQMIPLVNVTETKEGVKPEKVKKGRKLDL